MKKILLVLIMVILCCGCQANYSITIDKDLKVQESLLATEDEEFFAEYEKSSIGRVVGFILEPYLEDLNNNNYTVENYILTSNGGANITKDYASLDDFSKGTLLTNQFTDHIDVSKEGSVYTLKTSGSFSIDEQNQDKPPIDNATIAITVPFDVKEHNADSVNGNTYLWNFDGKDGSERELMLSFDSSKIQGEISTNTIIIIILGVIILSVIAFLLYNNLRKKKDSANKI